MNIDDLGAELRDDPLVRGYSGMDDQQAANDLNAIYRTRNLLSISTSEVYDACDTAELKGISATDKDAFANICALNNVETKGNTWAFLLSIFPEGTTTRTNLDALKIEDISRSDELGLGLVRVGHVEEARR